jgi:hypothetical protein
MWWDNFLGYSFQTWVLAFAITVFALPVYAVGLSLAAYPTRWIYRGVGRVVKRVRR